MDGMGRDSLRLPTIPFDDEEATKLRDATGDILANISTKYVRKGVLLCREIVCECDNWLTCIYYSI
eukprot:139158-Prorocentrum_minimum.AAC.3